MEIGGGAVLKLFGVSDDEAAKVAFRAVVLKNKRLEPDVEAIPILEGQGRKIYLEFQGYQDCFVRHRLMAKALIGCAADHYTGKVMAGIVYTDALYRDAALPANIFRDSEDCRQTDCLSEIVLTDYTEEQLREIDPRLILLAPFTISSQTDKSELFRLGKRWKEEAEKCYSHHMLKDALNVIGLFLLNRFRNITLKEVIAMLGFDLKDTVAGQQLFQQGKEEGVEKGMLDEAREMLIAVLEERFIILPVYFFDEIRKISRRETLKELFKLAIHCEDLETFEKTLSKVRHSNAIGC